MVGGPSTASNPSSSFPSCCTVPLPGADVASKRLSAAAAAASRADCGGAAGAAEAAACSPTSDRAAADAGAASRETAGGMPRKMRSSLPGGYLRREHPSSSDGIHSQWQPLLQGAAGLSQPWALPPAAKWSYLICRLTLVSLAGYASTISTNTHRLERIFRLAV